MSMEHKTREAWVDRLKLTNASALTPALLAKLGAPPVSLPDPTALPLASVSFRVVDIEATGLDPFAEDVIEAAVSEHRGGRTTPRYDSLFATARLITPRITELTGITTEMLAHAPALAHVFPALQNALGGDCWVAHNLHHDNGYLTQLAWRFDPHWQLPPALCTLKLARRLLAKEVSQFSLVALAEHLHLPLPSHRAASDVATTAALLAELVVRAEKEGARTLGELMALSQEKPKPRPRPHIDPLTISRLPRGPGLYRFFAGGQRLLYVGYSSDVQRRVREHLVLGRSPALVEQALSVECEVFSTTLEAYIAEGRALAKQSPALNVRNNEHGRLRYLRLGESGTLTVSTQDKQDGARYFGPVVLTRAERDVLRALRACFGLTARAHKDAAPDSAGFVHFATQPLGADAPPAHLTPTDWQLLLELKPHLWRAERERLDAERPFRHPSLVYGLEDAHAVAYAVGLGRVTQKVKAEQVAGWLETPPQGAALDWLGERVCAFVRAQPDRVRVEAAA